MIYYVIVYIIGMVIMTGYSAWGITTILRCPDFGLRDKLKTNKEYRHSFISGYASMILLWPLYLIACIISFIRVLKIRLEKR